MRTIIAVTAVIAFAFLVFQLNAAPGTTGEQEIVKALNEQNRQLARIATSLEKISGQQPGWKLPK